MHWWSIEPCGLCLNADMIAPPESGKPKSVSDAPSALHPLQPRRESSGDSAADGRFAWGQAALEDGDLAAAAELFEQALERVPAWGPAWMALAEAHERSGRLDVAIEAYRQAAVHDANGRLGAELRLAALGAAQAPAQPSNAYVSELFDQYAQNFEAHLVERLGYRGPELIAGALDRLGSSIRTHFARGLDIGCGTGLAARILRARVDHFDGADLAPAMVSQARRTGLYGRVEVADAVSFLIAESAGSADLVVAADVLVYLGDLAPLLAAVSQVLSAGGVFAVTAQTGGTESWALGPDLRYRHAPAYLEETGRQHGLSLKLIEHLWARREKGVEVPGLVAVFAKA